METKSGWTIIGEASSRPAGGGRTRRVVLCQCACGAVAEVLAQNVKPGSGCFACGRAKALGRPAHNRTHGESHRTVEHRTWKAIHERCENVNHKSYSNYGGRGIRVCDRWTGPSGFDRFLSDMGRRPGDSFSIERDDADGDYGPGNCRWATATEQANNKRNNRHVEAFGERLTVAQWSARTGLSESLIRARIGRLGWTAERALTEPAKLGKNQTSRAG